MTGVAKVAGGPVAWVRVVAARYEMDRTVSYAILTRAWAFFAGPISAILIASRFSEDIQGYYYTFGSILALQSFAELGMGVAITQFASHEWAHLRLCANGEIEGDPAAMSRLSSLARLSVKWYVFMGIGVAVALAIVGTIFFSRGPSHGVHWVLPWLALCALTGVTLFLACIWSLLEGCNQVTNVYLYRLLQSVIGSIVIWSAVLMNGELWASPLMMLAGILYAVFFLRKRYSTFLRALLHLPEGGPRVSWKDDILPFQWRIALSWICGYFIFSLFTPVLFHYHGPALAGQMGMTWSVVSVLSSVGAAWVSPRVPQFGMLISQRRFAELDRLFWRLTMIVSAVAAAGALAIFGLVLVLNHYHLKLASRLLPPLPTALLLCGTVLYTASGAIPAYLRAHKREPLVPISVLLGLLVGSGTWYLGKNYGAVGVAAGNLGSYVIVVPLMVMVWQRCRTEWHALAASDEPSLSVTPTTVMSQ